MLFSIRRVINKKDLLAILGFVLGISFVFEVGWCSDPNFSNDLLIAQIKGDNHGQFELKKYSPHKLQFILRACKKEIVVFEDWNSWGYFARSFTAIDKHLPNKKYEITRNCNGWTRNFPSTIKIEVGQDLVTDIDLLDGTWSFTPELSPEKNYDLILQGHFDLEESTDGFKVDELNLKIWGHSWRGHLVTNKIEITIPKEAQKYFYKHDPFRL